MPTVQSPPTSVDAELEAEAANPARGDRPIRLHTKVQIYRRTPLGQRGEGYFNWRNARWFVDVDTVEEGRDVRLILTAVFDLVAQGVTLATLRAFLENWVKTTRRESLEATDEQRQPTPSIPKP